MNIPLHRFAVSIVALFVSSGCTFIMGSPPAALVTNPEPQEVISPVLIYTTDCDFKKKIDSVGFIGARTAYPATYAAESVCNALNAELPGAMDAVGVKAVFKLRKFDLKTARPKTMDEDALAAGVKYVVAVSEPGAFEGSQQYPASVSVGIRLYDAESGEYRGMAEDTYGISLRDFSTRGPNAEGQRIAADVANKLARSMVQRCAEKYPYQCHRTGLLRFAEPRDAFGK